MKITKKQTNEKLQNLSHPVGFRRTTCDFESQREQALRMYSYTKSRAFLELKQKGHARKGSTSVLGRFEVLRANSTVPTVVFLPIGLGSVLSESINSNFIENQCNTANSSSAQEGYK